MPDTPKLPPRLVPTLTEIVRPLPTGVMVAPIADPAPPAPAKRPANEVHASASKPPPRTPGGDAELIERVVARVDLMLERRLRETVSAVVIEQALQMTPLLKNELGAMIHELVAKALADELSGPAQAPQ